MNILVRQYRTKRDIKERGVVAVEQNDRNNKDAELSGAEAKNNGSTTGNSGGFTVADAFEWVEMFAVYFAIGVAVLVLLFRHCPVNGESMMGTLKNGDVLIVSVLGYTPSGGDIIVCQSESYGLDRPLVKRVIATSGQTVSIDYTEWKVTVDGVELDEDYVLKREGFDMLRSNYLDGTFTVPEGMVFVMGDNRNNSKDSRSSDIGFIDERYILGRVVLRLLPISEFTVF